MVAPIITFVVAAGVGFLAWKTSTIEPYLPEDIPPPPADTAPADPEPVDDEPAEEEPADEMEEAE